MLIEGSRREQLLPGNVHDALSTRWWDSVDRSGHAAGGHSEGIGEGSVCVDGRIEHARWNVELIPS